MVLSENLGGEEFIHVTLKNGVLITVKTRKMINKSSANGVCLGFNADNCYLFDGNGDTIFGIESGREQTNAVS
jgi:hypothetical protein